MSDMTQTPDPFTSRLRLSALLSVIVFSGGTLLNTSCADERELTADARRVTTRQDLVGGPSALGELRDFVLENDRVKVIIQDKGYSRGFGVYGGGLIDADRSDPSRQGPPMAQRVETALESCSRSTSYRPSTHRALRPSRLTRPTQTRALWSRETAESSCRSPRSSTVP